MGDYLHLWNSCLGLNKRKDTQTEGHSRYGADFDLVKLASIGQAGFNLDKLASIALAVLTPFLHFDNFLQGGGSHIFFQLKTLEQKGGLAKDQNV